MTTLARIESAPVPARTASLEVIARTSIAQRRIRRVVIRTWAKEISFVTLAGAVLYGGLIVLGAL